MKIIKVLLEKGEMGRTELSRVSKINYNRLIEQISMLEAKRYVELVLGGGRIIVRLTEKGRDYGTKLLEIEG